MGELTTQCARGAGRWGRGKTPGNGGVFFFGAAFVVAARCMRCPYGPLGLCRTSYWRRIASRSHRTVSRIASWSYIEHAYPGPRMVGP